MAKRVQKQRLGQRLVKEFTEFSEHLRSGKPMEKRYTVRTVSLDLRPREFDAEAVRVMRHSLGVSQAVFAQILGVSTDLIASWEQGQRKPAPMACRLLELIEQDRKRWLELLQRAALQSA
jgi:putative transcriptional regulator